MTKKNSLKAGSAYSNPIYRPIFQLGFAITIAFLISVILLVWTASRNVHRIQPIHHHLEFLIELQQLDSHFQEYQFKDGSSPDISQKVQTNLLRDIEQLIKSDKMLLPSTKKKLQSIRKDMIKSDGVEKPISNNYRNTIQIAMTEEINMYNAILLDMTRNTRFEFYLSLIVIPIFTIGFFIILYFFRKQIFLPLHNLNGLISLIAEREYKTMPMKNIEPILQPLFSNYNFMVTRLAELELEHSNHRQILEENIRIATSVLVEQQQTLARSERLAILGEFVAGIAHELRNPLAGIQMALINFKQDLESEKQLKQIDLISSELSRMGKVLNDVLRQAKHAPEQPTTFSMNDMISDLVTLTRYQLPTNIYISYDIADDDKVTLPQEGLRQALLNLILNASQAIGKNDGEIHLRVKKEWNCLIILVSDNGPGFPEAMLNSTIQPFTTWKENGTGLGMAMVRRYIHNLHGELILKNKTPRGALVKLKLPC